MEFPKQNLEKVSKIIQYNILVDLYLRNNENPEQTELVNRVSSKFKELFNSDISKVKSQNKYIETYLIPEGTQLSQEYISQVKKVCDSVGVNVVVDPEYLLASKPQVQSITKNDYVIVTHQEYLQHGIDRMNSGAGAFILLDSQTTNTERDYTIHGKFGPNSINSSLLINRKINDPSQSVRLAFIGETNSRMYDEIIEMRSFKFVVNEVPDAPLAPKIEKKWDIEPTYTHPPLNPVQATLDDHGGISLDKLSKEIEASIMVELYHRNKNNPDKSELINKLKEKFSTAFNKFNDITKSYEASYISTYVIPEGTNISQIYIEKAQEICKNFGLNMKINPTGEINQNDYVLLSARNAMQMTPEKLKLATGASFVLDQPEFTSNNGMDIVLSNLKFKGKNISTALITKAGSYTHNEIVNNSYVGSKLFVKSVPEAPKVKNAWNYGASEYNSQLSVNLNDKIKNIRENINVDNNQTNHHKLG